MNELRSNAAVRRRGRGAFACYWLQHALVSCFLVCVLVSLLDSVAKNSSPDTSLNSKTFADATVSSLFPRVYAMQLPNQAGDKYGQEKPESTASSNSVADDLAGDLGAPEEDHAGIDSRSRVFPSPIRNFKIESDRFWLDGQPFLIKAGELHYPYV